MKIFRIAYSEFVPVYDIEVEAENESEAYDKAKEILTESLDEEPDFWNCEEVIKVKSKDKR
ncbi:hypothetical protein [Candidatus Pelagibacter sp. HIMB1623]|uniref:hypothetical protein n=1 Tax=Candidatus Pelagibacter sp. HIMB1623 TaxID=3413358 RepID=UPI003F83910A